jgi:hypothetical protein
VTRPGGSVIRISMRRQAAGMARTVREEREANARAAIASAIA